MTPEVWKRAKEVLPAVRELPLEERAAFLDKTCGDDAELRREIESFLATDPEALAFIERPPIRLLGEGDGFQEGEGRQLGAYRILRRLGSGGMGVVYLATRVGDEFKREVAIKVVPPEQTSPEAEQRFLQEMGILAKLNHPNIAKLHEGGRTDDGRLYYLMEYVEGQPIDDYCRQRTLSLEERLRLFQKVAAAVQYAHTQLIIHRDIKPSNVLVTAGGEPKVLDFGVAKPLEGAGIGNTVLTGGDQKLFTPDYASPEQLGGQDIHIASDVYSLGVLLYELLAGDRPYRLHALAEHEMRQKVCDETPAPPSSAPLDVSGSDAEKGPSATDPTTAAFRRKLEGDLDTIVLMALRKSPAERYATVQQLSDDIERHLVGLPIKARTPSLGYRARKFIRRNRVALTIAGLFLLVIGGASWALTNQYRETTQQRDQAEAVTDFMQRLFQEADIEATGTSGAELTALDLLGRGAERVEQELQDHPLAQAKALAVIGSAYSSLGEYERAAPFLNESLEIRRDLLGEDDPETTDMKETLAIQYYRIGRYEDAGVFFEEVLETRLHQLGENHELVARTLNNLGLNSHEQGRFEEAREYYEHAARIFLATLGPSHLELAYCRNNLARTYLQLEDTSRAEDLLNKVRVTFSENFPREDSRVATNLASLASLYSQTGKSEEAEAYLFEVLDIRKQVLPVGHPYIGITVFRLGSSLLSQDRYPEAEEHFREALRIFRGAYDEEHKYIATTLAALAEVAQKQGRIAEAEQDYEDAIAMFRATVPGHRDLLNAEEALATLRSQEPVP